MATRRIINKHVVAQRILEILSIADVSEVMSAEEEVHTAPTRRPWNKRLVCTATTTAAGGLTAEQRVEQQHAFLDEDGGVLEPGEYA